MKNLLIQLNACFDARHWAEEKDFETIWSTCPRGDWMLWLARKVGVDKQVLTLAKGHCANTVRHLMKDERSIKAVDAAIAFGKGEITENELAYAAYAAAYAAADAAAYAAADAAAYAADAAADAAAYAADAAYAAYAAKENSRMQTANICREYLTEAVREKIQSLLK